MSTFPTRIITLLDLPEPKELRVDFQYNFFTPDERVNDTGSGFRIGSVDKTKFIKLRGQVPRFVKISWTPATLGPTSAPRIRNAGMLNGHTLGKIQSEQTFSNYDFVGFNFQDLGLTRKMFAQVTGSIVTHDISEPSHTDAAWELNEVTRETVDGDLLTRAVSSLGRQGIIAQKKQTLFSKLENLGIRAQINNKVVGTVVRNSAEDTLNPYHQEMSQLIFSADSIQADAIQKKVPFAISTSEWDVGFVPIATLPLAPEDTGAEVYNVQGVGYIITRDELGRNGKVISRRTIVVNGLRSTAVVDPQVRYGATYRYQVKLVALVSLPGTDDEGNISVMRGLIASRGVTSKAIHCVENVPPPAPGDMKMSWDYKERGLRLLWSFPVNSQRDIKYFQIFRRKSINDPFEIIGMYDFDDSVVPVGTREVVEDSLIKKMKDPTTTFIDHDFTKDSTFIYTLCSCDAHGLTSNYSQQFKVSFDRFSNKTNVTLVSQSGAPKAYPNLYVRQEAFIDVIKTSGFKRMNVYFDPDYLRLVNDEDQDLKFLPWDDPNAVYKMLLVNTDRQQSATVDITLNFQATPEKSSAKGGRKILKRKIALRSFSGLRPTR
jgi:hypothetical protein